MLLVTFGLSQAAAFARLCVETVDGDEVFMSWEMQPPSRGCVLKRADKQAPLQTYLAAAFARLCVETKEFKYYERVFN